MSHRRIARRSSRGYSLMEILVVIAIIGLLSLVTVPAFMNYQRRNQVRTALRSFTSDLRSFRQYAITKNAWVRVQFEDSRNYSVFQSRDNGATWRALSLGIVGNQNNQRTLPTTIQFTANTYNDSDNPADTMRDIDFRPDGTAGDFTGSTAAPGTVTLTSDWKDILNRIVVDMSTTGQITTKESQQ